MYDHDYLIHYGVEGMRWGIRRYQPYTSNPRKDGKAGKFLDIAKKNEVSSLKVDRKISKLERKRDNTFPTVEKRQIQSKIDKYKSKKEKYDLKTESNIQKAENIRESHAKEAEKFLNVINRSINKFEDDSPIVKDGKKMVEDVLKDLKDSDFNTYQSTYGLRYLITRVPQYRVESRRRW